MTHLSVLPNSTDQALSLALSARQEISNHVLECRERQLALLSRFDESRDDREAFRREIRESLQILYGILWKAAFGLVGTMTLVILAMAGKLLHL